MIKTGGSITINSGIVSNCFKPPSRRQKHKLSLFSRILYYKGRMNHES